MSRGFAAVAVVATLLLAGCTGPTSAPACPEAVTSAIDQSEAVQAHLAAVLAGREPDAIPTRRPTGLEPLIARLELDAAALDALGTDASPAEVASASALVRADVDELATAQAAWVPLCGAPD